MCGRRPNAMLGPGIVAPDIEAIGSGNFRGSRLAAHRNDRPRAFRQQDAVQIIVSATYREKP